MMLPIKTMSTVLNVLTYIITSMTACSIGLTDTGDNFCFDLHNYRYSYSICFYV